MIETDYLIIGGSVAGTTAAETLREKSAGSTITILEADSNSLYSRVQLYQYVRGMKTREQIFLRSFDDYKQKNIDFRYGNRVVSLDAANKLVKTDKGEDFHYGKLLICTGGFPRKLNKYPDEISLYSIEDADKVIKACKKAKKGVVIGSGFIALEFIENFKHFNLPTFVYMTKDGFMGSVLKKELSDVIIEQIKKLGVEVIVGEEYVYSASDEPVIGTGIGLDFTRPFFSGSGLTFEGGLVVDSTLKTNLSDIYAAGDIAKFFNKKLDRYVRYGNWTNALTSGKTAGRNMAGENLDFDLLSSYTMTIPGLSLVFLGFTAVDSETQVTTQSFSSDSCGQFFIRNGKLDGCVLVNRGEDRAKYSKIIESRENF